jgi:S-DNA-T family DNA segregation ATPase FtsK/SpoIIIE
MILPNFPLPVSSRRLLRRSFKVKLKKATVFSVGSVLFFSLAGLVLISFTRQGLLLIKLNHYLVELLGWVVIFLPFVFTVCGLMLTRLKTPVNEPHVLVGSVLFALASAGLTKSGLMGKEIWLGVVEMITAPGAFLVLSGGVLIGLIVLFNTSIDQVVIFMADLFKKAGNYIVAARAPKVPKILNSKPFAEPNKPLIEPPVSKALVKQESSEEFKLQTVPSRYGVWEYPPLSLLSDSIGGKAERGDVKQNAEIIEKTLESFGISARVVDVNPGPTVTQYALQVAAGTKLSKITALSNDLALALAAPQGLIRIEAPIPGKSQVGIELPNRSPEFVTLRKMLESDILKNAKSKLTVALGLDVAGEPRVVDIARMPHVLIAGATGSGKTVLLNAFIASLLFRTTPDEVRLILVDPKRVELVQFNGIPHLLAPVIVEPEKVISALKWVSKEMEKRYKLFAQVGARNIDAYNGIVGLSSMSYLVFIIDELADIMLFAPVEVEDMICRIAQMARATGIHLVIATQRPSVDVLTGLIKANIPCRISFAVASMVDSRVIIDQPGAEKLLGRGDMLYVPPDQARPTRIQGAFVSDAEINRLINFLKNKQAPSYTEEVTEMPVQIETRQAGGEGGGARDPLFKQAVEIVCQNNKASSSLLQRKLSIGYSRAAKILDQMQEAGIVGPPDGSKAREVINRNPAELVNQTAEETAP